MSRGFASKGENQQISDTQDFSNFMQAVAGDGDVTVKQQLQSEPLEPCIPRRLVTATCHGEAC